MKKLFLLLILSSCVDAKVIEACGKACAASGRAIQHVDWTTCICADK